MTHRIASHSGMSGRYRTMPKDYLNIPEDVENITKKVKLADIIELDNGNIIYGLDDILDRYYSVCEFANSSYSQIVDVLKDSEKNGTITNKEFKRLREFYRGMLPQHNMTERVTTMNLRSFANFQKLRNSEHAQPEIKLVAKLMLEQVKLNNSCPISIEWLEKNKWEL
jgi:thymidylate synthase ThyX